MFAVLPAQGQEDPLVVGEVQLHPAGQQERLSVQAGQAEARAAHRAPAVDRAVGVKLGLEPIAHPVDQDHGWRVPPTSGAGP